MTIFWAITARSSKERRDRGKASDRNGKEDDMKVMKKRQDRNYKELYTERYEFRLCGGSVNPADKTEKKAEDKKEERI